MLVIDRYFDISRAEDDLGYRPVVPPEEGWRRTVAWFKENPP
jgi:nucleoside-diphosphate-sugar epimerase